MELNHLPSETLYDYGDGVLPEAERYDVDKHLAVCPLCRSRLARSRALPQALKAQLGHDRAPLALRSSIRARISGSQPGPRLVRFPSLSLSLMGAGIGIGVLMVVVLFVSMRPHGEPPPLLGQLAEIHARLAQDPRQLQVRGAATAVSEWFQQNLQQQIRVPVVEGFQLLGGRLEQIEGLPAAHLLYQQDDSSTLSLLVWQGTEPLTQLASQEYESGRFYTGSLAGESVVIWPVGNMRYACVSSDAPERLLDVAGKVRRNLTQ